MARKDEFFSKMALSGDALAYGDVRLRTGYSAVMPDQVSLESRFTRNVGLKIPLVSAAMDTVTEAPLAIALAKLGGLGVIHRNLDPSAQAHEVSRVKYHLNGCIQRPICVRATQSIEEILALREHKGYTFHSFPVLDAGRRLVGILTQNDFDFCSDRSSKVADAMTKEIITAPPETTLSEAYEIMKVHRKKVLPLVDSERHVVGLYIFTDLARIKSGEQSSHNLDARGQLIVGAAIGVLDDAFERVELLAEKNVDVVVIDTAHADAAPVYETLREIKASYPNLDVMVGNVSEYLSARSLCEAGADGIKVGQGPGSICTTRIIAGIGCPQVTAVYNCAHVANQFGVPVCADGGIEFSGDIPIAIGAGATSVMMGSLFAGTKEAPGEIVFLEGRRWKGYRGMGSIEALEVSKSSRERYRQVNTGKNELIAEGIGGLVDYKGDLADVVTQYVGGLRRGMGYVGAATIEELREKADFLRVSPAGRAESHPHGLRITQSAPNYRVI